MDNSLESVGQQNNDIISSVQSKNETIDSQQVQLNELAQFRNQKNVNNQQMIDDTKTVNIVKYNNVSQSQNSNKCQQIQQMNWHINDIDCVVSKESQNIKQMGVPSLKFTNFKVHVYENIQNFLSSKQHTLSMQGQQQQYQQQQISDVYYCGNQRTIVQDIDGYQYQYQYEYQNVGHLFRYNQSDQEYEQQSSDSQQSLNRQSNRQMARHNTRHNNKHNAIYINRQDKQEQGQAQKQQWDRNDNKEQQIQQQQYSFGYVSISFNNLNNGFIISQQLQQATNNRMDTNIGIDMNTDQNVNKMDNISNISNNNNNNIILSQSILIQNNNNNNDDDSEIGQTIIITNRYRNRNKQMYVLNKQQSQSQQSNKQQQQQQQGQGQGQGQQVINNNKNIAYNAININGQPIDNSNTFTYTIINNNHIHNNNIDNTDNNIDNIDNIVVYSEICKCDDEQCFSNKYIRSRSYLNREQYQQQLLLYQVSKLHIGDLQQQVRIKCNNNNNNNNNKYNNRQIDNILSIQMNSNREHNNNQHSYSNIESESERVCHYVDQQYYNNYLLNYNTNHNHNSNSNISNYIVNTYQHSHIHTTINHNNTNTNNNNNRIRISNNNVQQITCADTIIPLISDIQQEQEQLFIFILSLINYDPSYHPT